jgi:hypothetical protein
MFSVIKNRTYHKYEKESSKLRMIKGGAWTINLDKVNLNEVDNIVYETKKYIYSIDREFAQKIGVKLFLGNENKLVIPLNHWKKLKKEK